jgi:hypothetical protein
MLKLCDCGNLTQSVISGGVKYNKCSGCSKQLPFEEGDTLLRMPLTKPSGAVKNRHIIKSLHNCNLVPFAKGTKCHKCSFEFVKYAILDNMTWYKCTSCLEVWNNISVLTKG